MPNVPIARVSNRSIRYDWEPLHPSVHVASISQHDIQDLSIKRKNKRANWSQIFEKTSLRENKLREQSHDADHKTTDFNPPQEIQVVVRQVSRVVSGLPGRHRSSDRVHHERARAHRSCPQDSHGTVNGKSRSKQARLFS